MRDPNRIDTFLNILSSVWKAYPDLRLGQLLETARLLYNEGCLFGPDLFYFDDDKLQKGLLKMNDLMERHTK